ncbi:MAG: hypothetical protein V4525_15260 [Pseudomonadota bacterium]
MNVLSLIFIFVMFMWVLISFRGLLEHLGTENFSKNRPKHSSFPVNDPFIRDFLYKQKDDSID